MEDDSKESNIKKEITEEYNDMIDTADILYNSGCLTEQEYFDMLDDADQWYENMKQL